MKPAPVEFEASLRWPFGNGVIKNSYILHKYGDVFGPNSLAEILRQWGWLGIFCLIYFYSHFVKMFYKSNLFIICFVFSIGIVMFSNPFIFKYLIYAILFYILLYKEKELKLK